MKRALPLWPLWITGRVLRVLTLVEGLQLVEPAVEPVAAILELEDLVLIVPPSDTCSVYDLGLGVIALAGLAFVASSIAYWRIKDAGDVPEALGILLVAPKAADLAVFLSDLILGCEEPSDRSDLPPMTANIPSEAAKALGLTAPGDEAYIEVTEVNSDGSVVVMAEVEDTEDSAPPPPAPAPAAMPEELGKMLGS